MTNFEERRKQLALSNAYLGGELIPGVKIYHNSHVRFQDARGNEIDGWIVSVEVTTPEPIYTIECEDGSGDVEVLESRIKVLFNPHKMKDA